MFFFTLEIADRLKWCWCLYSDAGKIAVIKNMRGLVVDAIHMKIGPFFTENF